MVIPLFMSCWAQPQSSDTLHPQLQALLRKGPGGGALTASDWPALQPKEEALQGLASATVSGIMLHSYCSLSGPFFSPSPGLAFARWFITHIFSSQCSTSVLTPLLRPPPQELSLTLLFPSPSPNPSASPLPPKSSPGLTSSLLSSAATLVQAVLTCCLRNCSDL